jgi:hypothetical protein
MRIFLERLNSLNFSTMYHISLKHILCVLTAMVLLTNCSKEDDIDLNTIPISELQLDGPDYILLSKGAKSTVRLRIFPSNTTDKSIEWKSNNEEVATINNGVITAVGAGNALITATSNSNPEKKIEIRVRVNPTPIESIRFNVSSTISLDPNQDLQIISIVMPQDADQELVWMSSDKSIVSVDNEGKVQALSPGEAIISATSASDETKSASIRIIVGGTNENMLDNSKFVGLPHSPRYNFSQWGTSDLSVLWDNVYNSLSADRIFYIDNEKITHFGIDLGVKAKLTSMRYWGRKDNFFTMRHPKKIMIYGTNDSEVANNADSPDEDWILLTEVPFKSFRPSGESLDPPLEGDMDWTFAMFGERYTFSNTVPAVRYVRFKCLETWGNVEGFWGTEIAFWGTVE